MQTECGSSLQFDCAIRLQLHQHASPALTAVMRGASFIGSPIFLIPAAIVVVAYYLWQRQPRPARLFVIIVIGAEVLDQILKLVFHRARPLAFFGSEPLGYSFPSGHAMVTCSFFCALAVFAAARTESRAWQWTYWVSAGLLAAVIGISRIYLGVHYPSDVLGGYVAALVWVFSVVSAAQWGKRLATIFRP